MLMKSQFQDTMSRLGLDEDTNTLERDLAEIVWMRCEAAFLQKSSQTAALLENAKINHIKQNQLNRQEIQFLTTVIAALLSSGHDKMCILKDNIAEAWLLCDPEDKETAENFQYLNRLRNYQRDGKTTMIKLANIQRKLKKLR